MDTAHNSQGSILRLFSIFCLASLVVFFLIASAFTIPKVKETISNFFIEQNNWIVEAEVNTVRFYLDVRQQVMIDLAGQEALINASMLGDASDLRMISLLNSFKILGETVPFSLYNIVGEPMFVGEGWIPVKVQENTRYVQQIIDGGRKIIVDFIVQDRHEDLLLIMVPVLYQGGVEGVLAAQLPFNISDVSASVGAGQVSLNVIKGGTTISQDNGKLGEVYVKQVSFPEYDFYIEYVFDVAPVNEREWGLLTSYGVSLLIATVVSFSLLILLGYKIIVTPVRALDQTRADLTNKNSELATVNGELSQALNLAKQATESKSRFLANMSHEIRTPMNGVIGALNVALTSNEKEEQTELIRTAAGSANVLLHIINDILDFTKLEAGKLDVKLAPFSLRTVLEEVKMLMQELASEKKLHLKLELSPKAECIIETDAVRVRQILTNLVSNAIKFTKTGKVVIAADVVQSEEQDYICIKVKDSGVGISKEDQLRLFRRFEQIDNENIISATKGTGLGLAICKQLTHILGGEIGVESTLGEGSVFWFEIPIVLHEGTPNLTEAKPEEVNVPSLHILLAEDIAINQMIFEKMLARLGHSYEVAENGREVIELLNGKSSEKFDLILMDNQMPEMGGIETTKHIRESKTSYSDIPIIALTADALVEQQAAFKEVGMDGFVSKPVEMDRLRSEIALVLNAKAIV